MSSQQPNDPFSADTPAPSPAEVFRLIAEGFQVVVDGIGQIASIDPNSGMGQTTTGQSIQVLPDGSVVAVGVPQPPPPAASGVSLGTTELALGALLLILALRR